MAWRVANSLIRLRDQANERFPTRNKSSDGTIGDASHRSRSSDHNPWVQDAGRGVVTALDLTHDPKSGMDTHKLAEHLRVKRDRRIKYVISAGRIFSSQTKPWQWRKYTGSNGHYSHMHVSVSSSKALYDNTAAWDLPSSQPEPNAPEPQVDLPSGRPVLRVGAKGEAVRTVQTLLMVKADGKFGATTQIAVRAFQRGAGLETDGVVGPLTWAELDDLEQVPTEQWHTQIIATVFGGAKDPNKSAYEERWITDEEFGVALPARFTGDRPQVVVANEVTGKTVTCEIVDVGPWNTDDPYWVERKRPQAESGSDKRGRRTNKAGIDLTPAAARAIGLKGLGPVSWSFATENDEGA